MTYRLEKWHEYTLDLIEVLEHSHLETTKRRTTTSLRKSRVGCLDSCDECILRKRSGLEDSFVLEYLLDDGLASSRDSVLVLPYVEVQHISAS